MRRLAISFVLMSTTLAAQQSPPAPPAAAKSDEIDLRKECGTLEQVWKRRTALHWLKQSKESLDAIAKTIDPSSANQIQALVNDAVRFNELDYHFVEKMKNCEQRVLNQLRGQKFRGVADLLEVLGGKNYPASVAFANLAGEVELNWRWAARKKLLDDGPENGDATRELNRKLAAEAARIRGTAGHALDEIAKDFWKDVKPDDFPASWFDPSCDVISFEFGAVPDAKDFPRVDLATATREELLEVPEIEADTADAILRYRKKNGILGPEELRFIETIPADQIEPLETLCTVSRAAPMRKKQWTVMVYLNAANNLEPFGIKDMNEMESAGSSSEVNVVVECARFKARPAVRPNGSYMTNPFTEQENPFYVGLDASPGTRRYYVLKDDDKMRIRSVLLENVGDTDCGRPEPLADFGKWAAEHFPAEHYALVIWNHGAGWSGVSYDENTRHQLDLPDVRVALEGICGALKKQGKEKLDVLDFDACLMATLEVAYELRDTVDFLASSQETEPGDGMAYGEYLRWLDTYPEAPAASLAKAMVETYVKSYAPGGVQTEGDRWFGSETKSALRLSRMTDVRAAIEEVAKLLQKKPDLLGEVAERILKETRTYMGLVDIQDFLAKVSIHEKSDAELKAAVERVNDLLGYPDDGKDHLVNEVVIKRRTAGNVIWGFNNWASPPRNLAPFIHQSRFAKTPLVGPDEKGDYVCKISFPPMLKNGKSGKLEFVSEIDYQFEGENEKRTIKDFANSFFTADFAGDAAVIAEGHNVGNNRSHGLSLYFPSYLGFNKDYRHLKFAEQSAWADLCEKFPLKKLDQPAPIALLGLNHVTKGARDHLGEAVVFEDLEKRVLAHDFNAQYAEDLKALGRTFDAIKDPRPYGEDWTQMLEHYRSRAQHETADSSGAAAALIGAPGVVILDNHTGGELGSGGMSMDDVMALLAQFMPGDSPFGGGGKRVKLPHYVGPEGRDVMRHLQAGGRLLLGAPGVGAQVWDTPLYRDVLGVQYVRQWDRGVEFTVSGVKEIASEKKLALELARKSDKITVFKPVDAPSGDAHDAARVVEPFALLPDGQWIGARIRGRDATSGKEYRAVVFGFYLADVKSADDRRALLSASLSFLETPSDNANISASATSTDPVAPPASGAAPKSGGS